jgi:hypothetical protein
MARLTLARAAGAAVLVISTAGCSWYVHVDVNGPTAAAVASQTVRPDEVCSTGLLQLEGIEVCLQQPTANASGAVVAVGFVNPRSDAAALITPRYEVTTPGGTQATGVASMIASESGMMALPGGGWARDFLEVPADTSSTTVQLQVSWLPGKGSYPPYTRLQLHTQCLNDRPFTGCLFINRDAYPISVRILVLLISNKPDGSWVLERAISDGPDVVLPVGGADTFVQASGNETRAIADWLALDATNTFSIDMTSSLDQPEFPNP